mmetsp:Transcript_18988/g.52761  ORF Transcript_18988/g.52761 Transcript_18988/m.52761 type:complete len:90 (-) Transcript_18988:824-1093(-)
MAPNMDFACGSSWNGHNARPNEANDMMLGETGHVMLGDHGGYSTRVDTLEVVEAVVDHLEQIDEPSSATVSPFVSTSERWSSNTEVTLS